MDMDKTAEIYHGFHDIYDQVPDNIEPLCRIYYRYVAGVAASLSLPAALFVCLFVCLFVWRFALLVDDPISLVDELNHVRMSDSVSSHLSLLVLVRVSKFGLEGASSRSIAGEWAKTALGRFD